VPGWPLHQGVYAVLGLDASVCGDVDKILDEEPPTIREVASVVREIRILSDDYNARLPIHSGFKPSEFPIMYRYVIRTKGYEGVLCLLTHFTLDFLESLFTRGERLERAEGIV